MRPDEQLGPVHRYEMCKIDNEDDWITFIPIAIFVLIQLDSSIFYMEMFVFPRFSASYFILSNSKSSPQYYKIYGIGFFSVWQLVIIKIL